MRRIFPLIAVVLFLVFFGVDSFAEPPVVTVRGEAEIAVPADRAVFSLAVVTEAETSEQALKENSEKIDKVLVALQRSGLAEKEISTGQFTVNPRWSNRPRNAPENWEPRIIGFTVTNRLRVKTRKLELVGELFAAAVKSGVNEVQGLQFDLSDPRQYRQEAIRVATARAQEDARVLADAAGSALGDVVSLSLDNARAAPINMRGDMLAEVAMSRMAPPVIPGEVKVRASVTAVYVLK